MADSDNNQNFLSTLYEILANGTEDDLEIWLEDLHPAEVAHLLESLPGDKREQIWSHVQEDVHGEVLIHLNDELRSRFINQMHPHQLVAVSESLDTDDLADLLPEMPQAVIQEILLSMETQDRDRLRAVLSYADDTAGGLMEPDTVSVRADTTLDVVLRYLRRRGELPEGTDMLFVVDRDTTYQGYLTLNSLLTHDTETLVEEVMKRDLEGIQADMPSHEVANLFERRDLITAPVVDNDGRLLGRITIDDVVDVIRDTADHRLMSMAGLNEEEDMFAPVFTSTRRRAIWLGINLLTAFMASWVIGRFDGTIEKLVALAILMPVVASMGGIAGSQTLTLMIRGMALGHVTNNNAHRLLLKELGVGIWNGVIWAIIIGAVAGLWFQNFKLSMVIAAAILLNLIAAALAGATLPMLLKRFGVDPALSGTVVLTTVTDMVGFLLVLSFAAALMPQLTNA